MMNTNKQKESSLLIQLADKIDDPELKKEYLLKLGDVISDEPITSISQPYTLQKIFQRFENPPLQNLTLQDLQKEIKDTKQELQKFKQKTKKQITNLEQILLQKQPSSSSSDKEVEPIDPIKPEIQEETTTKFINLMERITYQKWNINIIITIQDSFKLQTIALVDSGAQINCIQEELIPTKFFEKTEQKLSTANGENLRIKFKISDVHICNGGIYIKQSFILVKDNLDIGIILGQPFIEVIKPFTVTNKGITTKLFQQKILFAFNEKSITKDIDLLKTVSLFKEHSVNLIKTKENHLYFIKQEVPNKKLEKQLLNSQLHNLLNRKLITPSKSSLSYAAFYINKNSETARLVINYKPLNIVRHPIPNKKDLSKRLTMSEIILRFDLKSGF
ncbi:RVP domain-containing protein [Cephalotus follicularis]|uniref:RVP domain-containing protein n=1 Tax=Cephalotus follicularis TaxID=3775 RepID=A0A1Q3B4X7_CEPFO|nr:RVP domain-containing protein [Cephalotus follicularis]